MANVTQRWPVNADGTTSGVGGPGVDGSGNEDTAAFSFDTSQEWPESSGGAPHALSYHRIQESEQFRALRNRLRRFVFPATGAFIAWYLLYVLLAAYAPGFMSQRLFGEVNVGLVLGLLQFVTTLVITTIYVRFAARRIDPEVNEIRAQAGVNDK